MLPTPVFSNISESRHECFNTTHLSQTLFKKKLILVSCNLHISL